MIKKQKTEFYQLVLADFPQQERSCEMFNSVHDGTVDLSTKW